MPLITSSPNRTGETWCAKCPEEATEQVGDRAYCHQHALDALFLANSPAFNQPPVRQPAPPVVVIGDRPAAAGPSVWVRGDLESRWIPDSSLDYEAQVVTADADWAEADEVVVELEDGSRRTVPFWAIYREP